TAPAARAARWPGPAPLAAPRTTTGPPGWSAAALLPVCPYLVSRLDCLVTRLSYPPTKLENNVRGACAMQPRNAIVTGASHGIGQYSARALAARHMNLLLVARSEADLVPLAAELRTDIKVSTAAIDLGAPRAAQQVAEAAVAGLGPADVLVNNAAT